MALGFHPWGFLHLISRCQVHLTDICSQYDENYEFMLVFQDLLPMYLNLRPPQNMRAEVAMQLLSIFFYYLVLHVFCNPPMEEILQQTYKPIEINLLGTFVCSR